MTKSFKKKIAFVANNTKIAKNAAIGLSEKFGNVDINEAEIVVALGGDGFMLQTLHKTMDMKIPVYGMNCGSIGFLMNKFHDDGLLEQLDKAIPKDIYPLFMSATDANNQKHHALALNEVSLFRSTFQAAKIEIIIDGKTRLKELICDGVLLATPAGSTAYNLSAHGPILPIDAPLLALTPISPFRPRRWRGAILHNDAKVTFRTLEAEKRPISAVADNIEFENIIEVEVHEDKKQKVTLLFDPGHGLEERVLNEQFQF